MEPEEEDKGGCFSRINIEIQSEKAEVLFWGEKKNYTEFKWKVNIFSSEHLSILC